MKILSLSTLPLLPHLGSGKTRLRWTEGLRQLGNQVDLLQPADFELWPSRIRAKKYRQAIGVFLKVKELLKTNEYDIIEFYGDEYWLLLLWLKKKNKRPLLVAHVDGIELHDMDKEQQFWNPQKGLKGWLFKQTHYRFSEITFRSADRFVCGCDDDLQYVLDKGLFNANEASCISPALDEPFHLIPFEERKKEILLFLGSWIDRKGIRIIPEVITKVLEAHPTYEFHVYGAWHAKDTIRELFFPELKNRVKIFDKLSLDELKKGILESSIFFFPSYSEGFGLATAEAMACSCAVVTTRTGIGSNLINGQEAVICDFDDTKGMESAISSLIDNEPKRLEIAKGGYARVREFKWSSQVAKLDAQYQKWMNEWNR